MDFVPQKFIEIFFSLLYSYCILVEGILKGFFFIFLKRKEVKDVRKKLLVLSIGLIFALSVIGVALAQEKTKPMPIKPAETAKPAEPAKPGEAAKPAEAMKPAEAAKPEEAKKEEVKKEAPPKPVMYRAGGIVLAVDAKTAKITLEQREVKLQRKLTLKVSKKEAQQLAGINVGDLVDVWVTGSTVTKLMKVF